MKLFPRKNTPTETHIKADKIADDRVPDGLLRECPKCHHEIFPNELD